jgi:2-oxoglutarate ferredoxin oxidoreductase subunit alpha
MMSQAVLTGEHFMSGDFAAAEGAIAVGCRFFAGYPITPSTEIAERLARRLPQVDGHFVQMEDELASMAAVLGASCAGVKAMTATSGPGFSLMQENIGLGFITETPCVLIDVQRGGPSTGLPTLTSQADMMQAKWGSHGDYEVIAYAPSSPQEMFDFTVKAFNASERYRTPVFVMADEIVGHMMERVIIPKEEDIPIINRRRPQVGPGQDFRVFQPDMDGAPPMALAGEGYRIHLTGLTHDERGYPATDPETQHRMLQRLLHKIQDNRSAIIEYEEHSLEDAKILLVTYGSTARSAMPAMREARDKGMKVGMLRLLTCWPFPEEKIQSLADRKFIVPEVNFGQMAREVERFARYPVKRVSHAGGDLMKPEAIAAAIEEVGEDRRNQRCNRGQCSS